MLIRELFENTKFDELNYVKYTDDGREIDFDIIDDLIFFMNNDDDVYRKYTIPLIATCKTLLSNKKKITARVFKPAVITCYKLYAKQFPIRELPDELEKDTLMQLCKKLYMDLKDEIQSGKYKDF